MRRQRGLRGWLVAAWLIGGPALGSSPAPSEEPPPPVSTVSNRILAAEPGETLIFSVGDDVTVARVDRDGLSSRGVDLERSGAGLRGRVGSESVRLAFGPGRITGKLGDRDVALDVTRVAGALQVMGRFGAREIALEIGPQAVGGEVGPCFYDLHLRGGVYRGDVSCGAQPRPVQLQVPVALIAREDVEVAALLTPVMAR